MEKNNILIHVGFHKTGSTFIRDYFASHSEVQCLQEEITSFANFPESNASILSQINFKHTAVFITNMRLTVNSWGQTAWERIYGGNSLTKDVIQQKQKTIALELKKAFPDAKILISTREISNLKQSLYSQYILNRGIKSLIDFLADENYIDFLFDFEYVQKIYGDIFGKENVIGIKYETLKNNPKNFLSEICRVINIPYQEKPIEKVNPSLSPSALKKRRLKNKIVHFFLVLFPLPYRNYWFQKYIQSNTSKHV